MRYVQGGGLTDAGRAARERVRLQAAERFETGQKNREIAAVLRVSERSVERWRRQWRERGEAGSCRRDRLGGQGSVKRRSRGWNGSWNAGRWPTAGPTSGGRFPGLLRLKSGCRAAGQAGRMVRPI
ncbi:helix-turn-helix domain-containing protein [Streptomyces sp. NPDC057249]|uniref:helix-turn-helix domain-containing protein n=1 Tax=Streptomyces sp. NPDC057249 TaxID=3346067 RepID=UPI003643D555